MAIQIHKEPIGYNMAAGPLTPPKEFNFRIHAAKWVKEGQEVEAAGSREYLLGSQYTADGWQVWKDKEGRPFKIPLKSGTYILLHRDRAVQDAVNAIYGNVGKKRLMEERQQAPQVTPEGVPSQVLDDATLARVIGKDESSEWGEGDVNLNRIPSVEASSQRVGKPRLKTTLRSKV